MTRTLSPITYLEFGSSAPLRSLRPLGLTTRKQSFRAASCSDPVVLMVHTRWSACRSVPGRHYKQQPYRRLLEAFQELSRIVESFLFAGVHPNLSIQMQCFGVPTTVPREVADAPALCYGFLRRATVTSKTLTLATSFLRVKRRIFMEVIDAL